MDELIATCQVLGIPSEELSKPFSIWRFDTLHVRGVDQLTSEDIYNYFGPIHPHSIEWLSNISCNATFDSTSQACNALQAIAAALIVHKKQNLEETGKLDAELANLAPELTVKSSDTLEIPVPPNYRYILGSPHEKAKAIIVRFATINDKKVTSTAGPRPEPMDTAATIPEKTEKPTNLRDRLTRNRLNRDNQGEPEVQRSFNSARINADNPKATFRMRMRADEEEQEQRKQQYQQHRQQRLPRTMSSRLGTNGSRLLSSSRRDAWSSGFRSASGFEDRANRPFSNGTGGGVSKSKNAHVWRRSVGTAASSGGPRARNDLRSRLTNVKDAAMVRVRVSYDDEW